MRCFTVLYWPDGRRESSEPIKTYETGIRVTTDPTVGPVVTVGMQRIPVLSDMPSPDLMLANPVLIGAQGSDRKIKGLAEVAELGELGDPVLVYLRGYAGLLRNVEGAELGGDHLARVGWIWAQDQGGVVEALFVLHSHLPLPLGPSGECLLLVNEGLEFVPAPDIELVVILRHPQRTVEPAVFD